MINTLNGCGRIVEALEVEVNNVNYTMNVDFDTKSTNINLTTITNFEPYQYNKEIYRNKEESYEDCFTVEGVHTCIDYTVCDDDDRKIISPKTTLRIGTKNSTVHSIINN